MDRRDVQEDDPENLTVVWLSGLIAGTLMRGDLADYFHVASAPGPAAAN